MLKSRRFWIGWGLAGLLLAGVVALEYVNLSALEDPSAVETYVATKGKHFIVSRSARESIPPAPEVNSYSMAYGEGLFIAQCSSCHGIDGRSPTDIGQRMYPRAADLGSEHVQAYSNEELFWVIQNGIRLTGMPGLGNTQSDEGIWRVVQFVRTLKDRDRDEG